MSNIVTCEFLGRLGNNLWQIAAMIHYSKKHNVLWAIPPHYHHRQIYKYWKFPIYKGNIKKLPVYDVATDEGFPYAEIPFYPNGVKLRGFFQSYKYLDPVKEEVLKAWNFKVYPELKDFTSIHIRLGDYVTYADSFPPVTVEYVSKGIQEIERISGKAPEKFLVFSDDIKAVKPMLEERFPNLTFVYSPGQKEQPSGGKTEYEQLSLMSSCGNNIIANSSFSYIAAYANKNPDKIIITPSADEWFGARAKLDTKDLLPLDWHQVKFRTENVPA